MTAEDDVYKPQDALGATAKGTLVVGGAGFFVSAIQNSLQKKNIGAFGVFSRTGSTVAAFAAVGGVFEFSRVAMANLREKNDVYNTATAGFLGGATFGLSLGMGAFAAIALALFEATGGTLRGFSKQTDEDTFDQREYLRLNRRRPIEETIEQLGNGRGGMIHSPDYEEVRKQRIKEKYGIDIHTLSADPNAQ